MGILHSNVPVQQIDAAAADYGVAYNRRDNIGNEFHASQRAIQDLCKEFSQTCGFQLKVSSFSAKRNGSGNAKYVCKKLNQDAPEETIYCPFFFNVSGVEGFWKSACC
ncbi:uncharacterized protein PITG_20023 [Phytophthora infestans T30-4]|uniref:Uncharacterized protein n=1 Tax=Phytophthora infestans (strain T30-4) TaxID=403677 RepID=D0P1P3_PHYIT|nr:uncharacterized protein PITG_20023 [Phytophthora infestans T30-4]EEY54677.1 hypothetical protein PITG_20023 [Phytophthora infestans T30-4]|eukprot:XP_002895771.1 hypothetical protein PITG_20023 [Phytophthora infestans T30-4]